MTQQTILAKHLRSAGYERAQADMAIYGEPIIGVCPLDYLKGYRKGVNAFKRGIVKYPYLAQLPSTY